MDVGEAELAALVAEGEALVVDAEEVQQGGVEVVDVDGILGDGVSEFVGLAVDQFSKVLASIVCFYVWVNWQQSCDSKGSG